MNDYRVFNKKKYYISCITDENSTSTKATAQSLLWNICKLHDFLLLLILDRGFQFISEV